jgi:hypothetical protein
MDSADTTAEKRESHIVDITDQFWGKALIFTGPKKARTWKAHRCSNRLSLVLVPNGPLPFSTIEALLDRR